MEALAGHTDAVGIAGAFALAAHAAFLCVLAWASVVDARARIVPDGAHVAGVFLWVVVAAASWAAGRPLFAGVEEGVGVADAIAGRLAGGAVAAGFSLACALALERKTGSCALGGGDVKLLALAGIYLGAAGVLAALGLACVFALSAQGASALISAFLRRKRARGASAFCPVLPRRRKHACPLLARAFPFAPFISLAVAIVLIAQWQGCRIV